VKINDVCRGRILLVDDSPEVLEVFSLCLEEAGYKVSSASNGVSALYAAKLSKPDAIILDLWMPQLGGMELAGLLKGDAHLASVPLGLITAAVGILPRLVTSSFVAVMAKPCRLDDLLSMADSLMAKRGQVGLKS